VLRTPLCDLLGIDVPIFSVGFGLGAGVDLAAAVSNAGGCGVLGSGEKRLDYALLEIRRLRERTERPFGVNQIIAAQAYPKFRPLLDERISAYIDKRVPLLVLFWGDPTPYMEEARRSGVKIFVQVGSVDEAVAATEAGVDAVIAQGSEAGGHVKSTTSTWEIVPAVIEAVAPVPVLASGGIGDGEGIAKALRLGAQGVSLGTRFVASEEAWLHADYKDRVVVSSADDTVYGDLFDIGWPGAPHRTLRNKVVEEWEAAGRPPLGERVGEGSVIGVRHMPWGEDRSWLRYETGSFIADFDGDPEYAPMWAGRSVEVVNEIKSAAEIIRDLVHETEEALAAATP
jgi:nitronate monooxygenase/enoyl-[acyl-carrier protein] reductase II